MKQKHVRIYPIVYAEPQLGSDIRPVAEECCKGARDNATAIVLIFNGKTLYITPLSTPASVVYAYYDGKVPSFF